jgi:hypothetical protein
VEESKLVWGQEMLKDWSLGSTAKHGSVEFILKAGIILI